MSACGCISHATCDNPPAEKEECAREGEGEGEGESENRRERERERVRERVSRERALVYLGGRHKKQELCTISLPRAADDEPQISEAPRRRVFGVVA